MRELMKKLWLVIVCGILLAVYLAALVWSRNQQPTAVEVVNIADTTPTPVPTPKPISNLRVVGNFYEIPIKTHIFQTFNNCGPASLSMLLSYKNMNISQKTIGEKLRPWQNPQGINDDKSVTVEELAKEAEALGFTAYHRPGGSMELLKTLIANDNPVLVRTYLKPGDDIGHYRIVRGFDELNGELIQDDSLQGKDLRYKYEDFENLWKPFGYEFLVISNQENDKDVREILGELTNEETAWQKIFNETESELGKDPNNTDLLLIKSVAAYKLGRYEDSITTYEKAEDRLPKRTLWYQIEPVAAYLAVGNYQRVFEISERIFAGQNAGYSEMYILRGKAYEALGEEQNAKEEYQKAVMYNVNLNQARELLAKFN